DGVMELEANFLNVMARVVRYEIDGDRLRLLDENGSLLAAFIKQSEQ
ncbi:MAG: META domain-containing protein, partial [Methylomicrobium sp.]|nr:META domain-containing protein [Methylomicrobium sp.]